MEPPEQPEPQEAQEPLEAQEQREPREPREQQAARELTAQQVDKFYISTIQLRQILQVMKHFLVLLIHPE
jgi:hypothetical protein